MDKVDKNGREIYLHYAAARLKLVTIVSQEGTLIGCPSSSLTMML